MQLVDVLKQVGRNVLPERIKDNPRAFAPGHSGRRHKIAVAGDQHNGISLLFQRKSGDVHADAHIDGLLLEPRHEVVIGEVCDGATPGQQVVLSLFGDCPLPVAANFAQSQSEVWPAPQSLKQS